MSTQTINKEEDLIILSDDSAVSFDIFPKLVEEESKVDENIISFDEFESNEKSKNESSVQLEDIKDDDISFSFDLGNETTKVENDASENDNSFLMKDTGFDSFSSIDESQNEIQVGEKKSVKDGDYENLFLVSETEKQGDVDLFGQDNLNLDKKSNIGDETNSFGETDLFGKNSSILCQETDIGVGISSLDDNFDRNFILDEAIKKLETRKQKVIDFKNTKNVSMQNLLQEIERLKNDVKKLEDEIEKLDDEVISIDSDIESIKTLLDVQENTKKRKHDSNKLKS